MLNNADNNNNEQFDLQFGAAYAKANERVSISGDSAFMHALSDKMRSAAMSDDVSFITEEIVFSRIAGWFNRVFSRPHALAYTGVAALAVIMVVTLPIMINNTRSDALLSGAGAMENADNAGVVGDEYALAEVGLIEPDGVFDAEAETFDVENSENSENSDEDFAEAEAPAAITPESQQAPAMLVGETTPPVTVTKAPVTEATPAVTTSAITTTAGEPKAVKIVVPEEEEPDADEISVNDAKESEEADYDYHEPEDVAYAEEDVYADDSAEEIGEEIISEDYLPLLPQLGTFGDILATFLNSGFSVGYRSPVAPDTEAYLPAGIFDSAANAAITPGDYMTETEGEPLNLSLADGNNGISVTLTSFDDAIVTVKGYAGFYTLKFPAGFYTALKAAMGY